MRNLKQTELQRLKNRGKKGRGLRIRPENEKKKTTKNSAWPSQKIDERRVEEKPKTGEGGR